MAEIKTVTADDLRQMEDQEGLVLQGCGGDLQEWVDGINDLFTEAGILQIVKAAAGAAAFCIPKERSVKSFRNRDTISTWN